MSSKLCTVLLEEKVRSDGMWYLANDAKFIKTFSRNSSRNLRWGNEAPLVGIKHALVDVEYHVTFAIATTANLLKDSRNKESKEQQNVC